MRFSQDHRNGSRAAVLLATCIIVLMGAIGCATIALAGDPDKPLSMLVQVAGVMVGVVFLVWLLRDKPPENHSKVVWSWLARRRKRRVAYRAQAKLPPSQRSATPPAPPTAESIRALTGGTSTWVPLANSSPRRPADGESD